MRAKYKVGDKVYLLVDIGMLKNKKYIPVKHIIVDRFTGDNEEIYYSLKKNDETEAFKGLECDEIHERRLFDTKEEAEKSWLVGED